MHKDARSTSRPVEDSGDYNHYLRVRRITLDEILLRRLRRESTVEFHEGTTPGELIWEEEQVVGVRWQESGRHLEGFSQQFEPAMRRYLKITSGRDRFGPDHHQSESFEGEKQAGSSSPSRIPYLRSSIKQSFVRIFKLVRSPLFGKPIASASGEYAIAVGSLLCQS